MGRMTDDSSTPVDLRIKRKCDNTDEHRFSHKKKPRHHHHHASMNDTEIPLDLSTRASHPTSSSSSRSTINPASAMPYYDPTSLLFNSSALLYDLFLANLNSYCQQQPQLSSPQQHHHPHPKIELPPLAASKTAKQPAVHPARLVKDCSTASKHESFACSCGQKYSNVAQLVGHLKITNHSAQLSSTHDEVAKLVRGQDIWLSRDTNPANQILKCLRCSSSFETLPDLTAHMMKTNHFTQLLPTAPSSTTTSFPHSNPKVQHHSPTKSSPAVQSRSTCLVCSQQFLREVDLVDHLQRLHQIRYNCTTCGMYFENENIYKEHLLKEMHHRNGKANKNRDYFLNQCKSLHKRTSVEAKPERAKSRSPIDKEVERLTLDLLDRITPQDEPTETKASTGSALSLLQSFVGQQTPPGTLSTHVSQHSQIDLNNNCDDDTSNQSATNTSDETSTSSSSSIRPNKSLESPLASLEKMLAYPATALESAASVNGEPGTTTKKKKFDKYRLFAEKMLRSTLS